MISPVITGTPHVAVWGFSNAQTLPMYSRGLEKPPRGVCGSYALCCAAVTLAGFTGHS